MCMITERFVVHKTKRAFLGMALDQEHEQLSALDKVDGGSSRT